jgi:DinB superfamily
MKRNAFIPSILLILGAVVVTAFAESHVRVCDIHAALSGTSPHMSVSEALDFWIGVTEKEVVGAADAMPEEKYSFTPTAGQFTGVRTFGEQVKHLAANNYRMAAYIMGERPTAEQENETGPASVQTKAQIMAYVRGSFAALHRAMATISTGNMIEPLNLFPSPRQRTRLQLAVDVVAHSYDHYGQIVEYLRMNGIVPPASRK